MDATLTALGEDRPKYAVGEEVLAVAGLIGVSLGKITEVSLNYVKHKWYYQVDYKLVYPEDKVKRLA